LENWPRLQGEGRGQEGGISGVSRPARVT